MATRCEVHYSGTVQGVGFRYTATRTAGGFDVTGTVRNLPDGRVELVAEGEPGEVAAFLRAVEDRMGGYISDKDVNETEPTGEFSSFGIR